MAEGEGGERRREKEKLLDENIEREREGGRETFEFNASSESLPRVIGLTPPHVSLERKRGRGRERESFNGFLCTK